jgi:uncharacterized protein YjiS (DUF1127 family)
MSRIRRILTRLNRKLRNPTKSTFDHTGYKQLIKLSDDQLRDIGISRGDIYYVCSGGTVR